MNQYVTYWSTNGKVTGVSFRDALLKGLAEDGGLFMPDQIPSISSSELAAFRSMEYHRIAACILEKFIGHEVGRDQLEKLCRDAYNFDIPLERVTGRKYILRLDQGPTASFKDFAARMMSRLMQHFAAGENRQLTILTATSGDTGSAVANAFFGLSNIKVIILFPVREVTDLQRKQMTTLGGNISVVAVEGKFDDCQSLVKKAFTDASLKNLPLSSANSINIGRLLPQIVYYIYAWSRVSSGTSEKVVFSVPSGNFGNLTAGLFAKKMGLPVDKFIISTNSNDEVPEFLGSGRYAPVVPSRNCISSAMNVGHPSNLARMVALYGGAMDQNGVILNQPSMADMTADMYGLSVTDDETKSTIAEVWKRYNVLLEPHGAVAWKGLSSCPGNSAGKNLFISLETAHPAKFSEEIRNILNITPPLPASLEGMDDKEEFYEVAGTDYSEFKKIIIENH